MITIDDKMMIMAAEGVSHLSNDNSTKIGAIISDHRGRILGHGFNRTPHGVVNSEDRQQRPAKYQFFEHAERDAIYNCARFGIALDGATIYLSKWFPCVDCARAIISCGIVKVFAENSPLWPNRWFDSLRVAYDLLTEAGVKMELR